MCGNVEIVTGPGAATSTASQAMDEIQLAVAALGQSPLMFEHQFGGGIYARTMKAPAGCLVVGKVHATENFFALTKGKMRIYDEKNGTREISAPHVELGHIGARRIGYCHTEVEWTNFFATTETDVAKLEAILETPREVTGEACQKLLNLLK